MCHLRLESRFWVVLGTGTLGEAPGSMSWPSYLPRKEEDDGCYVHNKEDTSTFSPLPLSKAWSL